jgi:NADH-quinone oxidoreductase subunit E
VVEEECLAGCDLAPVVSLNYVYYDRVTEAGLDGMIASIRAGDVPEASRGGVPGDLREISRVLAGLGSAPGGGTADG